jgi:protein TonB
MTMPPHYLARLGLDQHADERDIRRAYSRELKLIDQEENAADFQALRAAYEAALEWLSRRDWTKSPGTQTADWPVPAVSGANPVPENQATQAGLTKPFTTIEEDPIRSGEPVDLSTSPAQDAAKVFNEFIKQFDEQSSVAYRLGASEIREQIQSCANDQRLMKLGAREAFEQYLAVHLIQGWRTNHEMLLAAAAEVFSWRTDRHRVKALGAIGLVLERAMLEWDLFEQDAKQQKFGSIGEVENLLYQLRHDMMPDEKTMFHGLMAVENMRKRYPTWLPIVTAVQNIARWRELRRVHLTYMDKQIRQKLSQEQGQAPAGAYQQGGKRPVQSGMSTVLIVVGCLAALCLASTIVAFIFGPKAELRHDLAHTKNWTVDAMFAPGSRPYPLDNVAADYGIAIESRIVHQTRKYAAGTNPAQFDVFLAEGFATRVMLIRSSGESEYDAAVATAIRSAQPYPTDALGHRPLHFIFSSIPDNIQTQLPTAQGANNGNAR